MLIIKVLLYNNNADNDTEYFIELTADKAKNKNHSAVV